MFIPKFYPRPYYSYNMGNNYNNSYSTYNSNSNNANYNTNNSFKQNEKKDTASCDTIPFSSSISKPNFEPNSNSSLSLFGITLEIDDLIIIGLIILLFLQKEKNYTLIIVLGLILLNVNLSDVLNLL